MPPVVSVTATRSDACLARVRRQATHAIVTSSRRYGQLAFRQNELCECDQFSWERMSYGFSTVARPASACTYSSFMTREAPGPRRWQDPRAAVRVAVAASLGILAGGVVSLFTFWQAATLIGWDVGVLFLGVWIWWAVGRLSPAETKTHATREDTSIRLTELIVLAAGVAVLAAVGLVLVRAGGATGATKAYLITLGVVSVGLSWGLVHTVFTLRYARTYYSQPVGGIDFNEDDPPSYLDFAYLALTIGMTFQVSDTNLTTKAIRRIALACSHTCSVR